MPFEPIQLTRNNGASITLDKMRRLRLSSGAKSELKLAPYQHVYVSVDVENKRIGVVRMDVAKLPGHAAIKMDKRGYLGTASGKAVASKLALTDEDLPAVFSFIGKTDEGGAYWATFELTK
ncbi:hypothetical protein DOE78_18930 [Bacillus sp. Y1]|nr:hypothetical protein [Bacillus sp. Y1]AYA77355.1 hypothetical protein DOE78_18930 [Bacillus sp. Y1]